jgi:hypothetical protein
VKSPWIILTLLFLFLEWDSVWGTFEHMKNATVPGVPSATPSSSGEGSELMQQKLIKHTTSL